MNDETRIDPKHARVRPVLRVLGPIILVAGIVLLALGLIGFFMAFGKAEMPRFLWCPFVGVPLIFVGVVMTGAGYAGAVARYQAGEIAPVAKDPFNYMADGTSDGIKTVASAIGEGLRDGLDGAALPGAAQTAEKVRCHQCNILNDADARFCDRCGTAVEKSAPCPSCGELNDPDARFCDNCGRALPPA